MHETCMFANEQCTRNWKLHKFRDRFYYQFEFGVSACQSCVFFWMCFAKSTTLSNEKYLPRTFPIRVMSAIIFQLWRTLYLVNNQVIICGINNTVKCINQKLAKLLHQLTLKCGFSIYFQTRNMKNRWQFTWFKSNYSNKQVTNDNLCWIHNRIMLMAGKSAVVANNHFFTISDALDWSAKNESFVWTKTV